MSELIKLSTISKIKGGTGFPEKYQGNKSAEYPVVKVSEMEIEGNKKYIKVANNYLDQKTAILLNATIFPKDTIVFAKVGAALLLNRRRILSRESILDNNMMGLIVASEVNVNFLYQFLLTFDLGMLVQTGALPSVNQQIVGNIEILLPPLPQQRKIAKILTTVDNLIEKTEALIAKYQSIKHGMMHDLFTRGIDAKGELRPQQSEGMSNQKACLKDLVFNVKDKLTFNKDMSKPYLGLEHLPSSAAKLICKGSASDSISSNNIFESGDILFGKLRPRLKKCIQVNFDGYCSTDILVLRAYPTVCSKYAGKILQSDDVFKEAIRSEEGTKMPRTSWRSIKEIQVFTPPLSQQRKIAEILSKQDQLIEDHEKELMKYKNLKTALMQNLLTGKVQVSPDAEDKELAHA